MKISWASRRLPRCRLVMVGSLLKANVNKSRRMSLKNIENKTEAIEARVDSRLKADAEGVFEKLGLDASDAISLFYRQVALRKNLPFESRMPNAMTRKALSDAEAGRGVVRHESVEAMFDDILGAGWRSKGRGRP